MKDKSLKKSKIFSSHALITLAVICFVNPTVWLVDLLPDFIGCFIITGALLYHSDRAPFFQEARVAFIKLGIVSLAKIPGFFVLIKVRSANVSDYDISALLTFSFAVLEAYLFTVAIGNLFSAFYYLGERGDCGALIKPFKLSVDQNSLTVMKPETLKLYTLVFTYVKLAFGSLPEMLQLTDTNDYGSYIQRFDGRLIYPIVLLLGMLITLVMGIFFARLFLRYIHAIRSEKQFYPSADALISDAQRGELNLKIRKREIKHSTRLLIASCVFLFTLRLDNIGQVNLIPQFAFGILAVLFVSGIERYSVRAITPTVLSVAFSASSVWAWYEEVKFLDVYSFDLLSSSNKALENYPAVMNSAFVSAVALACAVVSLAIFISGFLKKNLFSGATEDGRILKERYRSHIVNLLIWCAAGILAATAGFLEILFKYYSSTTLVNSGAAGSGMVTSGLIPWFGTLVFILNLAFLCTTVMIVSKIKDDSDVYLKEAV